MKTPRMDRPELWSLIDRIARSHPPGGLRLTPSELVEWLTIVASNKAAGRDTRNDARRAAMHVPTLIGSVYEMPNYSPTPEATLEADGNTFKPSAPPAPSEDVKRTTTGRKPGQITALAPWMGSKRQLAGRIVELLGPHTAYYEPFCGSMAVLFSKPTVRHEVVNDLNRDLVNVAAVLQSRPAAAELLARLHFTLAAEELYREARETVLEPYRGRLGNVDRAYAALLTWWLGRNGVAGTKQNRTGFSARFSTSGGLGAVRWRSLVSSVPAFTKRLARVDVLNRDGVEVLEKLHDEPNTAVYCDPPYVVKAAQYQHDFNTADHERLAAALNRFVKARVVVSYYPHPRLADLYPAERWEHHEIIVTKNIRNSERHAAGSKATELLIVNRKEPTE